MLLMNPIVITVVILVCLLFAFICMGRMLDKYSDRFEKIMFGLFCIVFILFSIMGGFMYA